jgi:hypothetical protein
MFIFFSALCQINTTLILQIILIEEFSNIIQVTPNILSIVFPGKLFMKENIYKVIGSAIGIPSEEPV